MESQYLIRLEDPPQPVSRCLVEFPPHPEEDPGVLLSTSGWSVGGPGASPLSSVSRRGALNDAGSEQLEGGGLLSARYALST